MESGELFDQSLKLWWYISLEDLQKIQPTLPFREQLVLLIKMEKLHPSSFADKSPRERQNSVVVSQDNWKGQRRIGNDPLF